MGLSRRDLMKAALITPLSGVIPVTVPETVVGAALPPPEISDWDWPPHCPGDFYVFRQRLHRPPTIALMKEVHAVNRVPWRSCRARTVQIERLEASCLDDGSWRVLRFLRHKPDSFDLRMIDAEYAEAGFKVFRILPEIMFQGIDFGEMWQPWQPWDGTWA